MESLTMAQHSIILRIVSVQIIPLNPACHIHHVQMAGQGAKSEWVREGTKGKLSIQGSEADRKDGAKREVGSRHCAI